MAPPKHTGPRVERGGEDHPERMERGARTPRPGHDKSIEVPEDEWEANNRPRSTADTKVDEEPPAE